MQEHPAAAQASIHESGREPEWNRATGYPSPAPLTPMAKDTGPEIPELLDRMALAIAAVSDRRARLRSRIDSVLRVDDGVMAPGPAAPHSASCELGARLLRYCEELEGEAELLNRLGDGVQL